MSFDNLTVQKCGAQNWPQDYAQKQGPTTSPWLFVFTLLVLTAWQLVVMKSGFAPLATVSRAESLDFYELSRKWNDAREGAPSRTAWIFLVRQWWASATWQMSLPTMYPKSLMLRIERRDPFLRVFVVSSLLWSEELQGGSRSAWPVPSMAVVFSAKRRAPILMRLFWVSDASLSVDFSSVKDRDHHQKKRSWLYTCPVPTADVSRKWYCFGCAY